jgi:hypothetical protein
MSKIEDLKPTAETMPAQIGDDYAAFATAADANLSSARLGPRLTFRKGKYYYGKEKTELPLGTKLIAVVSESRHGYEKWGDNKIAKSAIWRVSERPILRREEMGETNEDNWPISMMTDKAEDPFNHVV